MNEVRGKNGEWVSEWHANPAARAATVDSPWGRYQIVHTRAEPNIYLVWYRPETGWDTKWHKIAQPTRFGPIPDSDASFRAWVQAWLAGQEAVA